MICHAAGTSCVHMNPCTCLVKCSMCNHGNSPYHLSNDINTFSLKPVPELFTPKKAISIFPDYSNYSFCSSSLIFSSVFIYHKWLHHLFNGLFFVISIREKLNAGCFNLPYITWPHLSLKGRGMYNGQI